jgi:hypothetical protein
MDETSLETEKTEPRANETEILGALWIYNRPSKKRFKRP